MRPKSLLLLALALGCGLVASIGISQVMDRNAANPAPSFETAPIYIALHNINLGDPIDASMVTLQDWPKDKIPQGAIVELEEREGRRPRTLIVQGEPILDAKLLEPGEVADPIGQIPKNMRLKTISVNAETSAAGLLSPGDRVDIQLFVARNTSLGIEESRTKVILQNIRVYAVDQAVQRSEDGETRSVAKTISLVLTPEQASKVTLAEQVGELTLIPRSPTDDSTVEVTETKLGDLLGDNSQKNSREQEQNRDDAEKSRSDSASAGLLSGIMTAIKKSADNRPPFVMEIIEGETYRVEEFDPFTGRPLNPPKTKSNEPSTTPTQMPTMPTTPAAAPTPATTEPDFPIDFSRRK